jgi:hypothetical protein
MKVKLVVIYTIFGMFFCINSFAQDYERRLCAQHTRTSATSGLYDTGWECSTDGQTSADLNLGDDTGWKNQTLQLIAEGDTAVCFRHTRWSSTNGTVNTGWQCSDDGIPSDLMKIGDDTGWKNQTLHVMVNGPGIVTVNFEHLSPTYGHQGDSIVVSQGNPMSINLGDDTGWKDQKINFTIE